MIDFRKYDNYRNVHEIDFSRCSESVSGQQVKKDDAFTRLSKLVFGVDDNGLPTNELSLYLGDNCSPELSEFIRKNLLQPVSDSNIDVDGVDDDTLIFLSRGASESRSSYVQRINTYMRTTMAAAKAKVERDKWMNSLKGQK